MHNQQIQGTVRLQASWEISQPANCHTEHLDGYEIPLQIINLHAMYSIFSSSALPLLKIYYHRSVLIYSETDWPISARHKICLPLILSST